MHNRLADGQSLSLLDNDIETQRGDFFPTKYRRHISAEMQGRTTSGGEIGLFKLSAATTARSTWKLAFEFDWRVVREPTKGQRYDSRGNFRSRMTLAPPTCSVSTSSAIVPLVRERGHAPNSFSTTTWLRLPLVPRLIAPLSDLFRGYRLSLSCYSRVRVALPYRTAAAHMSQRFCSLIRFLFVLPDLT